MERARAIRSMSRRIIVEMLGRLCVTAIAARWQNAGMRKIVHIDMDAFYALVV